MSNRTLNINELESGDILLFEHTRDCSSWAIAAGTRSNVSHTAMVFQSNEWMIDIASPGIRRLRTRDKLRNLGREVYVMRPTFNARHNLNPVMQVAQRHLNNFEPYPFFNLLTTLGVILMQNWLPTGEVRDAIVNAMRFIAAHLTNWINQRRYPDNEPMVCSQFVYHCYATAGSQFDLGLNETTVRRMGVASTRQQRGMALIDRARFDFRRTQHSVTPAIDIGSAFHQVDEWCSILLNYILTASAERRMVAAPRSARPDPELVVAVAEFSQALVRAGMFPNQRRQRTASEEQSMDSIIAHRAMFVTPADLLRACDNLEQVGVIRS